MARYWCINCQEELEHRESYCHSRCGNNCDAFCSRCNTQSLTTKVANQHDDDTAALKWATGEAQRRMRATGVTAGIEVAVPRLNSGGLPYDRNAYYNPTRGRAEFRT